MLYYFCCTGNCSTYGWECKAGDRKWAHVCPARSEDVPYPVRNSYIRHDVVAAIYDTLQDFEALDIQSRWMLGVNYTAQSDHIAWDKQISIWQTLGRWMAKTIQPSFRSDWFKYSGSGTVSMSQAFSCCTSFQLNFKIQSTDKQYINGPTWCVGQCKSGPSCSSIHGHHASATHRSVFVMDHASTKCYSVWWR